jgi:hypothetical protein
MWEGADTASDPQAVTFQPPLTNCGTQVCDKKVGRVSYEKNEKIVSKSTGAKIAVIKVVALS